MPVLERARHAAYLTFVVGAAISLLLALASSDAIALLPPTAFDLVISPMLIIGTYAVAFVVAPWVASRFPVKRW